MIPECFFFLLLGFFWVSSWNNKKKLGIVDHQNTGGVFLFVHVAFPLSRDEYSILLTLYIHWLDGSIHTVHIVGVKRKHWVFYSYSRHLGSCQKTTFHTHIPGDGHSGLSVDVYGPLLTEIASPIICSVLLADKSACAVWLDWSVIRVSIADSPQRRLQESHSQ